MKAQGIPAITVCLLLCLTGCAGRGQTETTSSGESLPAGNAGLLDHEDSRQEPPVAEDQCWRNGFLRHLYGGRESGRSCKRGYRIILFPR